MTAMERTCKDCGCGIGDRHGKSFRCVECQKIFKKEWQKKYRKSDKHKEYRKKYYKEYQKEYYKEYYKELQKSEKYKEYRKEYHKSDKYKEYDKEYRKELHPSYIKKKLKQQGFTTEDIAQYPELIEIKKLTLKIKRL
jgi:hypothetical protein